MKTIVQHLTIFCLLFAALFAVTGPKPVTANTVTDLLDSASFFYVNTNSWPDPQVWSESVTGNVVTQPVEGMGLGIVDPDNSSQFVYVYNTSFLSGDPHHPNFHNTATFRVRTTVPYISDGSSAWSAEAIGWQITLDDGLHRLELTMARTQSKSRILRVQNSTSIPPIDFPWDNDLENTYEIQRDANGDFQIILTNGDTSNPNPIHVIHIPGGLLPPSHGQPHFSWGMRAEGGGAVYFMEAHAEVRGGALANQPPVVGAITAPLEPVPSKTSIAANAAFVDPDVSDTHTAVWDWGDGSTSAGIVSQADGAGTVNGTHSYTAAGVYPVQLMVTDNRGAASNAVFEYIVVYDPSGGFITGGGWIDSPAGAYPADPALSGKASFGFVSRYQKGASAPTGNTAFMFQAADLNFRSTNYDWLVISGARAQFKGTGRINGEGEFGFLLTAVDGQVSGGGGVDRFRIKIWERASGMIVYDNQLDTDDRASLTTILGGGAIVIHK